MVLSIRKISTENEDLTGAGMLWFKNLNEPDAYLILPLLATCLNYFNLGVSKNIFLIFIVARNNEGERALVCEPLQVILLSPLILPPSVHSLVASRCFYLLDQL